MKIHFAAAVIAMFSLSSCDKATELLGKAMPQEPKKEKGDAAPKIAAMELVDKLRGGMEETRGADAVPALSDRPKGPLVRHVSDPEFQSFISTPGALVLVDFHADWCGPCKRLSPILEGMAGEFDGKVLVGKVNIDSNRKLADQWSVRRIPDVRLFRDGKQVASFVGIMQTDAMRSLLKTHTAGLDSAPPALAAAETPSSAPAPAEAQPKATFERMSKEWMPPGIQRR